MKIPHTVLERQNLCFISSYKNCKLKVKLWWVEGYERKKRTFFVPFILFKEIFLKICFLCQCIVYWIQFQNIHKFTYQKTSLHTLLLLVFKIVEILQCILKMEQYISLIYIYENLLTYNLDCFHKHLHVHLYKHLNRAFITLLSLSILCINALTLATQHPHFRSPFTSTNCS